MTNRAFQDAIYRGGNMPVEMVRLAIKKLRRDYQSRWKFYGSLAEGSSAVAPAEVVLPVSGA
jgi:hypothetical protein